MSKRPAPELIRTRSLLSRVGETALFVQFGQPTEAGDALEGRMIVSLTHEITRDLGDPAEITVTIEGGDLLNA